jgi:hypothetical protein
MECAIFALFGSFERSWIQFNISTSPHPNVGCSTALLVDFVVDKKHKWRMNISNSDICMCTYARACSAWSELVAQFPSAKSDKSGGGKDEKQANKPSARCPENTDLAELFMEIARCEKKLGGENVRFKVSGALACANAIRGLDFEVTSGKGIATGQKKLGFPKVKGVGKRSGEIIDEFLTNGRQSETLTNLKAQLEAMGAA